MTTKRLNVLIAVWLAMVGAVFYGRVGAVGPEQQPAGALAPSASASRVVLDRYCVTCHNQRLKTAGLALDTIDLATVGETPDVWEKVIRKLRAGVMPPAGRPRPDQSASAGLVSWLETELDRHAAAHPNPGRKEAFHRLNRAEYQNATRDLLGIEVDSTSLLPADDASYGFDNMAAGLTFSPTLMEKYLAAAKKVSRAAVGSPPPFPNFDVFRIEDDVPQDDRLEGLPFGTRGGTRIQYNFPVDGEYVIKVRLTRQTGMSDQNVPNFHLPQELELSLDGERLQVFTLPATEPNQYASDVEPDQAARAVRARPVEDQGRQRQAGPEATSQRGQVRPERFQAVGTKNDRNHLDDDWIVRFPSKAGPREVAVTFINRTPALLETLIQPYLYPHPTGAHNWGSRRGAYLSRVEISGPFTPAGRVQDTPSRRRIFGCRPARSSDEVACAKTILSTLTRRAYRRPVTDADLQEMLRLSNEGRTEGGFEAGIEAAVRRLLVSPEFLFRVERDPANIASNANYPVSDLELATRLSFFLWSSIPDDGLLDLAERGKLHDPAVLQQQVRRMLADTRSHALVQNFVGQWLLLRNVPAVSPDPFKDPDFDESLRQAMRRETELFLGNLIQEDRSILELLTANYSFLNERLAKHYGLPGVYGSHFRRVMLPEAGMRRGLLGQASILTVTSHADRTAPVLRGKWIMENLLGTPPPAPPANVPPLQDKGGTQALTMRQRMEEHRSNPACASCHAMMDPLGFALENFDQAGRFRTVDEGVNSRVSLFAAIDASGVFPDGSTFEGPVGLRRGLVSRADLFYSTMIEKLLTYAVGRGLEAYDTPAVRKIKREAARSDYRFSSLVLGVVQSLPFQMRRSQS